MTITNFTKTGNRVEKANLNGSLFFIFKNIKLHLRLMLDFLSLPFFNLFLLNTKY